jgi:hypothetical protein
MAALRPSLAAAEQPRDESRAGLQRVREAKVSRKRAEAAAIVSESMGTVQKQVDDARGVTRGACQEWEAAARADIQHIVVAEDEVRGEIVAAVGGLNVELQGVKQAAALIKDNLACLDIELQQVCGKARAREEQDLERLKADVEGEIASLERAVNQRIADANPVNQLTSYLARKMEEEAY